MPEKTYIQEAAKAVEQLLPDNHGFIVISVPLGTGGKLSYVSSMERADAIKTLKEFLFRVGEQEEWMKHIT